MMDHPLIEDLQYLMDCIGNYNENIDINPYPDTPEYEMLEALIHSLTGSLLLFGVTSHGPCPITFDHLLFTLHTLISVIRSSVDSYLGNHLYI